MTVDQLVGMAAPPVTSSSARFPQERQLVELQAVHVIAVKQEADSDLHVILQSAGGGELNVEAPMAPCDSASPYAGMLAQARAAMDKAMPGAGTGGYTAVNLTATIEGVLFFDVLHGQRGSPNGVERHPVTVFSADGSGPPAPAPAPTTTVQPPPVTTGPAPTTSPAQTTTAPGPTTTTRARTDCQRWPGRHWFRHRYHRDCQPGWFKTR